MLSGAFWEAETQQFSVLATCLALGLSEWLRDAEESVAAVGDDYSPLSDFFAKRYPNSQSQPHWKLLVFTVS